MMQFFAMGGYGGFVWSAYGVTILGLGTAIALTLRAYFRAQRISEKFANRESE